jgi:hypothetical protein
MVCTSTDAFWRILISDSNVAFVLPVYALCFYTGKSLRQMWPEISQLALTALFSFWYHLCDDADGRLPCYSYCLLHPRNLHAFDFIFSYQVFAVVAFMGMDNMLFKCVGMSVFYACNVVYFSSEWNLDEWLYTIIVVFETAAVLIIRQDINLKEFLKISPLALAAFACKLMSFCYLFFHSAWHILIALFLYCYVMVKRDVVVIELTSV